MGALEELEKARLTTVHITMSDIYDAIAKHLAETNPPPPPPKDPETFEELLTKVKELEQKLETQSRNSGCRQAESWTAHNRDGEPYTVYGRN